MRTLDVDLIARWKSGHRVYKRRGRIVCVNFISKKEFERMARELGKYVYLDLLHVYARQHRRKEGV
jgi:hypothetical protein